MKLLSGRVIAALATVALAGAVLGGCGGAAGNLGGSPPPNERAPEAPPVASDSGSMSIAVLWPARAEGAAPALVPQMSNCITVRLEDAATGEVIIQDSLHRPETPPWLTETRYEVRACARALLTVAAYPVDPADDPRAVAQAGGSLHVVIPGGGAGYPLDGAPGDPVIITMDSAVHSVRLSVSGQTRTASADFRVAIGGILQMIATAFDEAGRLVLVPGFSWSAENDRASVDGNGLVTGEKTGLCTITATETESGISGSASVEVAPPAISGTVTGLAGSPSPLVTVRAFDPATDELVGMARSASDGSYRIPVPPDSNYRVVADKSGYIVYEPEAGFHEVTVGRADVGGRDFTVTAPPSGPGMGELRGFVYGSDGLPVEGVEVTAGTTVTETDANGEFVFTLDTGHLYTVQPALSGFTFDPLSQEMELSAAVQHVDDFLAVADGASPVL